MPPSSKDTRAKPKCAHALLTPLPSTGLGTGAMRTRHTSLPGEHYSLTIVYGGAGEGGGEAAAPAVAVAAAAS